MLVYIIAWMNNVWKMVGGGELKMVIHLPFLTITILDVADKIQSVKTSLY